jgi:hypothetical protein
MPHKGQETDVIDRIVKKTIYEGECWLFQGKLTGAGYGNIWYKGKMVRIGRLMCHLFHGKDLDDQSWVAAHKTECPCLNCWNPEHLYPTTVEENVREQIQRGTFHYGDDNLNGGSNYNKELADKNRRKY